MNAIVKVEAWQTTDRRLFESESIAQMHQKNLNDVDTMNEVLAKGGTVNNALEAIGRKRIEGLDITQMTKLAIPHWQCCGTPGYRVQRFVTPDAVFVYGDVGSWSGSYGADVSLHDLAQYSLNTLRSAT